MSIPVDIRIKSISEYLGVSKEASLYIYLRKKRSMKKKSDPKYLRWSIQLQNALVKADKCIGFNWKNLQFGQEENELIKHGIAIGVDMENPILNEEKSEWIMDKNMQSQYTQTLKIMGFMKCKNTQRLLKQKKRKPVKKTEVVEKLETQNLFDVLGD